MHARPSIQVRINLKTWYLSFRKLLWPAAIRKCDMYACVPLDLQFLGENRASEGLASVVLAGPPLREWTPAKFVHICKIFRRT
jgi:hypothetical protein